MIHHIKGRVTEIGDGGFVVETGGIGYFVHAATNTLSRVSIDGDVLVYTVMDIKENDISLVGFLNKEDKSIFQMLVGVGGVGTKAALAMLSTLSVADISLAILTEEAEMLTRAPGIGKKIASRIVLELKDKLKDRRFADFAAPQQNITAGTNNDEKQDAIDALLSLGYSRAETLRAIMEIPLEGLSSEQIIRQSLKKLSSKN